MRYTITLTVEADEYAIETYADDCAETPDGVHLLACVVKEMS